MTTRTTRLRARRIGPGDYEVVAYGHKFSIWSFRSAYGDTQWMIDRDDQSTWGQTDTLRGAIATIADHGQLKRA